MVADNSIRKIISGGQTGADRAALDAAIEAGIPHGGAVPKGRRAEDGAIHAGYEMTELTTEDYDARTRQNVLSADATLILSHGPLTGGSALTLSLARRFAKPVLHIDLAAVPTADAAARVRGWLGEVRPGILNVAGPRESTAPGIYESVRRLLREVLA